jgi:hypothetical protein
MKSYIQILVGLAMILGFQIVAAQDFSGQYSTQTEEGNVTLTIQSNGDGYSGTLSEGGMTYQVSGAIQNGMLSGRVGDQLDGILFQAQFEGNTLNFTMVETDEYGNPDYASVYSIAFQRQSSPEGPIQKKEKTKQGAIFINNQVLSKDQIAEIEQTYGIKPLAGNYWYDARSGLYGVVGYQAYGFMLPNHDFGTMDRNASNGNTGVFVNGREIPLTEYTVWSSIVGNWIQPGAYWLDAAGNAGYEGNPMPVINLYQAAQQRAYGGGGGGGDNQWNTRFSAGNYNSDNSQGYVSVPGYGPVGYGF